MKTRKSGILRILPISSAVAALAMAGVSCNSTKTAGGGVGSDDDFYASTGSTGAVGEYDNIYDESGVQKVDDYSGDNSTYDYSDYTDYASTGSSGGSTSTVAAAPSKPKPASKPSTPSVSKPKPASSGSARYHVVQKGETLYRLSRNYGTSVVSIQDANNLSGDLIKIGQQLVIPPK